MSFQKERRVPHIGEISASRKWRLDFKPVKKIMSLSTPHIGMPT